MPAWAGATASAWKIPPSAGTIAPASPPAVGSVPTTTSTSASASCSAMNRLIASDRSVAAKTGLIELSPSTTGSVPIVSRATPSTNRATSSVRARRSASCCWRNRSSRRFRTTTDIRKIVRATTPAKPRVSRLWRVFGPRRRMRAGISRGSRRQRDRAAGSPSIAGTPVPDSALGEGVADATDGHDERRRGGVVLDLVAEVADVDVDRLLVLVESLVVAEQLQELAPGVDAAGSRGEMTEDLELRRREADPTVATLDAPPLEIDDEVAVPDHPAAGGVAEIAVRPAEQGPDPAHQLAQPERLRQVVVGAQLEADHLVDLVVAGGQDEDGRLRAGGPEPAQDLEAVHAREADVEHDEVRGLVDREIEALLAALRHRDLVALLLEGVLDPAGNRELILDDQDRGAHGRADCTPPWRTRRRAGSSRPARPDSAPRRD